MKIWMKVVASIAVVIGLVCSVSAQTGSGELRTGVFVGPMIGLKYQTPTLSGVTDEKGQFQYRAGEAVTFSIGEVVLGSAAGAARVNIAQIVPTVDGDIDKIKDPSLTNMVRFLETFDYDGNSDNGVTITPEEHKLVGRHAVIFQQSEEAFSRDFVVTGLLSELNSRKGYLPEGSPLRALRSGAAARNEIRRNIRGIIKTTDVKIPLRDGSFLYADVFRPDDNASHPVVMSLSVYGKAFQRECTCNPGQAQAHEEMEDRYFSGNPDGYTYENHETVNTAQWVPHGYATMRVDGRGTCKSPGTINVLSRQEANDYYDAIEWAAKQPWSNGNIGTWGMSYDAMDQENVASLQPPHLKAVVPVATDVVTFEDSLFNGGILNEEFWTDWWYNASKAVCGELKYKDFIGIAKAHPFFDPKIYGSDGEIFMTPDISKITIPEWITMPTEHHGHIHELGSSEAYIESGSKEKKLNITNDWFGDAYSERSIANYQAFFDHWLKGENNGIMENTPRVRITMRTGNGSYYVENEDEWPIARTQYTKIYLDATPSNWVGDGRRHDALRLTETPPTAEKKTTYSAEVAPYSYQPPVPEDTRRLVDQDYTRCWIPGMSFVTDPMPSDTALAGYMKLGLWVSSTSTDMDLYASVWVLDDHNEIVDYSGPPDLRRPTNIFPIGIGNLKVSHRKLDTARSTNYRPKHSDTEADYEPLKKNEIVPIEVELWPNATFVKKGYRIRLDLQPYDGCGGEHHTYDPSYHNGAENTIYTGPNHPSYLQLPIIPAASGAQSAAN